MKAVTLFGIAAAALSLAMAIVPAQAEEAAENAGFMAAKGRVTFRRYCASCHGESADGSGPVARMLKVEPTDLRQLTVANDGEFPAERLTRFIDGREEVAAHGRRDMPVWGDVFQTPLVANPAAPDETGGERAARKIRELVLFLETIQDVPEAAAPADR